MRISPLLCLCLAACPTTSVSPVASYCNRLEEVSASAAALCPDLFSEVTNAAICPETVEGSCTELELENLQGELDCIELIVDCTDLGAYEDCLAGLTKPSQVCLDGVATLFL